MLLAGDLGGTKTLLGLFDRTAQRPQPVIVESFPTLAYTGLPALLDAFAARTGLPLSITAAAVGVAGPVVAGRARLTNVPWTVSSETLAAHLGLPPHRAALLNDLEALATSVGTLEQAELFVLQEGLPRQDGHAVVMAAGTGLGQAYLRRLDGRLRPSASEGGHADFAARTDREMALTRHLRARYGRAEIEHVLCGPGLLNLHAFTHEALPCVAGPSAGLDPAARLTRAAMAGECEGCADALRMFVDAFGAEAGNLALRGMATAGVFIGGGIAPKILPWLAEGSFMETFRAKGSMQGLLTTLPVRVILNEQAGLLGAAVAARELP